MRVMGRDWVIFHGRIDLVWTLLRVPPRIFCGAHRSKLSLSTRFPGLLGCRVPRRRFAFAQHASGYLPMRDVWPQTPRCWTHRYSERVGPLRRRKSE